MRILVLSNFYPPISLGGYELWCQEVAENLKCKGHDVLILTSHYKRKRISQNEPDWIKRELHLEVGFSPLQNSIRFFIDRIANEKDNLAQLEKHTKSFIPDVILVWGMWNIHKSLLALAEILRPGKVVYYIGDYWPTLPTQYEVYWKTAGKNQFTNLPKSWLRFFALKILSRERESCLQFDHVLFPTNFMQAELKRKGLEYKKSKVILGAVNTKPYFVNELTNTPTPNETTNIIYVGRITPDKGVHTAVEALGILVNIYQISRFRLTIVGSGDPDYMEKLKSLVEESHISPYVYFIGNQSKESLPAIYHQADIFLFTSIWPEPFGRVIVEAMASGVAVIGSETGGASEILIDGVNSLTFEPGNSTQLAQKIKQLIENPLLRLELAKKGRTMAEKKFDIKRMAAEIEEYLASILIKT